MEYLSRVPGNGVLVPLLHEENMVRYFIRRIVFKHKNLFFQEGQRIAGFLDLLMKQRNTGIKWTKDERNQLKRDLKRLSIYIPLLIMFALPFGSLLIPLLAELADRRRELRDCGR